MQGFRRQLSIMWRPQMWPHVVKGEPSQILHLCTATQTKILNWNQRWDRRTTGGPIWLPGPSSRGLTFLAVNWKLDEDKFWVNKAVKSLFLPTDEFMFGMESGYMETWELNRAWPRNSMHAERMPPFPDEKLCRLEAAGSSCENRAGYGEKCFLLMW